GDTAGTERAQRIEQNTVQGFGLQNPSTSPVEGVEPFNNIAATFIPPYGHRGGHGPGACVFDYDRDGRPDLFVANVHGNSLYHNDGDGTFTDVTEYAGVGDSRVSFSAAAADVNGDGYLDMYVSNFVAPRFLSFWEPYFNGARNTLYLNDRDGTFTDVTDP